MPTTDASTAADSDDDRRLANCRAASSAARSAPYSGGRGFRPRPRHAPSGLLGASIQKSAQFTSYLLAGEAVTLGDLHHARLLVKSGIVYTIDGEGLERTARDLSSCVECFESHGSDDLFDAVTSRSAFTRSF